MPLGMCDQPEAVARGFGSADAPARCRGAGLQRRCGPQQQKRQPAIMGRQLQFLAGLEVELIDHADDGCRRARMQSFRKRPERLFAMRRFGEHHTRRTETERLQPMSGQTAMPVLPIGRHDDDKRIGSRQTD